MSCSMDLCKHLRLNPEINRLPKERLFGPGITVLFSQAKTLSHRCDQSDLAWIA